MTVGPRRALALAGLLAASAASCDGCRKKRFAPRGDAAAVVVLPPRNADEGDTPLGEEGEPNDTVATARLLAFAGDPLVAGAAGALPGTGKTADVDLFKVVIPGLGLDAASGSDAAAVDALTARRLIVEVRPEPGLAPALQLLDAAARPVVSTSAVAGERDGLPNVAVAPGGTYFLRLRADRAAKAAPGGPDAGAARLGYRLIVRVVDYELGDEREPNDRAPQATELGGAQTNPEVAGFFGWRRDEDWYRLPIDGLPAGTVLDLELDGVEGVTGALALHDGDGVKVTAAQGRKGERVVLRNVALAPAPAAPAAAGRDGGPPGRAVHVVVRSEGGRNLDRRYLLRVRAELAREGTETEPNDDAARAAALPDGLLTGFLPPGDADVFRYTPVVAGTLELEATPPDRVNLKLEILRAADQQPLAAADEAGRRQPERLSVPIDAPVLVRVTQRRGDGNADEPYTLKVALKPAGGSEVPR